MISRLLDRLERPFTLIVGKGGVGKTTTAGGLALALADRGDDVRLVSIDPAHSLADLFDAPADGPSPCTPRLVLEEVDAEAHARRTLGSLGSDLREIIDRGTYLDEEDAASLVEGSTPGLDEIGAALRLTELAERPGRLVVDTAPTGHTLRLLDTPAVVRSWIRVFEAMAAKADTVASALVGRTVRLSGEAALEELARAMDGFEDLVGRADFVLLTGAGAVVRAETARLRGALETRGLRVAATVAMDRPGAEADVVLPLHRDLRGCEALRAWTRAGSGGPEPAHPTADAEGARAPASSPGLREPHRAVLELLDRELVLFAGKGGVGKSTCAAAAALLLAESGPILLAGADPAGSLRDVLPDPPPGVEVQELEAEAELERFRELYREEVKRAFRAVGLDSSARMDRAVVESLWGLAPPGLDEVVAVARLAAAEGEQGERPRRTVLDTAPTGHFLRLMAMPELARDWVRRLMRILLKYRALGSLDAPAEPLVRFARRLRALQERLSDPSRTAIIIVTLDEPLVRAETRRLLHRLAEQGRPATAVVLNRAERREVREAAGIPLVASPEAQAPVGAEALRSLARSWERVA